MAKKIDIEKFNPGPVGGNQTAIVFVHGFSGDRKKTWNRIPEFLQADKRMRGWDLYGFGYGSHIGFDILGLWSADAKLEEIATKLNSTTETGKRNYKTLAFVAHSMGGLVVQRALLQSAELRKRTTHVFLFGTPSAGLKKASAFTWVKQQINNMNAGGEFIAKLRTDWKRLKLDTAPPFKFLSTAGESDQFVPPESSLGPFPEAFRRVIPGNHSSQIHVESAQAPAVKLLIEGFTEGAALAGPRNSARVAVEAGEFQEAIDRLWPGRKKLDDGGATQLAIALDRVGRRDDAIEVLRDRTPEGTDVLGVLAGRLKRRWLVTRDADDFQSALELYKRGYKEATDKTPEDHDQAHYHGINLAYLALAGGKKDLPAARDMATKVLAHVQGAIDPKQKHWQLASEADALMILGRLDDSFAKHKEVRAAEPNPWETLSIEEQSLRVADLCGLSKTQAQQLAAIYEGSEDTP
jgi:pimeloyl-ACP methyl ester carboxylesterase